MLLGTLSLSQMPAPSFAPVRANPAPAPANLPTIPASWGASDVIIKGFHVNPGWTPPGQLSDWRYVPSQPPRTDGLVPIAPPAPNGGYYGFWQYLGPNAGIPQPTAWEKFVQGAALAIAGGAALGAGTGAAAEGATAGEAATSATEATTTAAATTTASDALAAPEVTDIFGTLAGASSPAIDAAAFTSSDAALATVGTAGAVEVGSDAVAVSGAGTATTTTAGTAISSTAALDAVPAAAAPVEAAPEVTDIFGTLSGASSPAINAAAFTETGTAASFGSALLTGAENVGKSILQSQAVKAITQLLSPPKPAGSTALAPMQSSDGGIGALILLGVAAFVAFKA